MISIQESSCERVILNDLNRTFPAHEYFKDAGGVGQEALYKLSRVTLGPIFETRPILISFSSTRRIP